ncbi:biopolymer transporter ExbD [Fulvivirgaceae bacterium BMA10]|uniref:Biopolymer transporter ExbD n=1 Tax=Splendidivirga corallicola TaxID=3051826 RepID=A0ABT8KQ80_9BACT|nr:biopolymer transporter ExbD [Fulvivirgaceae bacterium BMA10]
MRGKDRVTQGVNAGSMADIAFLLLIFFLVTTQIATDKGILIQLPPKPDPNEPPPDIKFNQRNVFKILINSNDDLLVEDERLRDVNSLKDMVKEFVLNYGRNPDLSDSPKDAIVSIKADRGTSYETFITVYDQVEWAYMEMYGERVGMSADDFRKLDLSDPEQKKIYNQARDLGPDGKPNFPKAISIAQPSKSGGS